MATAPSYMAGSEWDLAQQQALRQRQMAEMLRKQSMEPAQGHMAGQYYVAPNWATQISKALGGFVADKQDANVDQGLRDARSAYDTRSQASSQALIDALSGKPASTREVGANEMDNEGYTQNTPAQAPDLNQALRVAMQNQDNPMMANLGGNILTAKVNQFLPKQSEGVNVNGQLLNKFTGLPMGAQVPKQEEGFSLNPGAVRFGADGKRVASVEKPPEPFTLTPGGARFDGQGKPIVSVTDQNKPFNADGTPNTAYQGYEFSKAKTGAANITQRVSTSGPLAFETELGKLDAKQLADYRTAAETASTTLQTTQNMRAALKQGAYSGGGAYAKTAAANIINGLTGATPKELPGSQLFNAEASKLVLDYIKLLGANPSNADREFITKTVPQLTASPQARDALINYTEQKAQKAIALYKGADAHARKNHGLGGFNSIQEPNKPGEWRIEKAP